MDELAAKEHIAEYAKILVAQRTQISDQMKNSEKMIVAIDGKLDSCRDLLLDQPVSDEDNTED